MIEDCRMSRHKSRFSHDGSIISADCSPYRTWRERSHCGHLAVAIARKKNLLIRISSATLRSIAMKERISNRLPRGRQLLTPTSRTWDGDTEYGGGVPVLDNEIR